MTFNIIVSHIFPENFIKFPLLCSENMKTISVNISYFQKFPSIFWIFGYFLVTKKLIFLRIALSYINKQRNYRKWWYCYWKLSFRETTYVACQSKAEKKNRVNYLYKKVYNFTWLSIPSNFVRQDTLHKVSPTFAEN